MRVRITTGANAVGHFGEAGPAKGVHAVDDVNARAGRKGGGVRRGSGRGTYRRDRADPARHARDKRSGNRARRGVRGSRRHRGRRNGWRDGHLIRSRDDHACGLRPRSLRQVGRNQLLRQRSNCRRNRYGRQRGANRFPRLKRPRAERGHGRHNPQDRRETNPCPHSVRHHGATPSHNGDGTAMDRCLFDPGTRERTEKGRRSREQMAEEVTFGGMSGLRRESAKMAGTRSVPATDSSSGRGGFRRRDGSGRDGAGAAAGLRSTIRTFFSPALRQLDDGGRTGVAEPAVVLLDDPGVAAGAVGVARPEFAEELLQDRVVADLLRALDRVDLRLAFLVVDVVPCVGPRRAIACRR